VTRHWTRASRPGRRILSPVLLALTPFLVVQALLVIGDHSPNALSEAAAGWAGNVIAELALPIGFLVAVLRINLARGSVAEVVRRLDGGADPDELEAVLRTALDDPSLTIGYPLPDGGWVDGDGRPIGEISTVAVRARTFVGSPAAPVAVLLHDPALASDPELVAAVGAAARMALENERLRAEVRAQLEEVRASRARLHEAGLEARRGVERDLHDGAQQRLLALSVRMQLARAATGGSPQLDAALESMTRELGVAIEELRELARGIHPPALVQGGLAAAVQDLADRAPLPVTVDVTAERFDAPVEATAWFVVSEAIANVGRHADAQRVTVRIVRDGTDLRIAVADDGVGGADLTAGTGLRGLADRVGAMGGHLRIESPAGAGTRLEATIPCG
jgi:signal transduction histidine kinase